jgi:protein-S-isoprenylcysteine O-methyltransferase Ste14
MLGLLLALLFALGWIPLYAWRAEAMQAALPHYAGAERRWVRLTPTVIGTHVTLACLTVSLSDPSRWRAALGAALFAAGVAFWFWGRRQIGPLRVTRLPDQPPLALRRDGAFGLVRNPLYFGYLVAAAAPLVVVTRPYLVVTFAACFAALAVRAAQEEQRLHAQLGPAYADYCRAVKRLVPFVW